MYHVKKTTNAIRRKNGSKFPGDPVMIETKLMGSGMHVAVTYTCIGRHDNCCYLPVVNYILMIESGVF